jgi:hypothetical protein
MALWRVRFDVPHSHCIRPGMGDYRHAQEIILQGADAQPPAQVMREPVTGLWMLRPQAADQYDYEALSAWTTAPNTTAHNASWWIAVRKGLDPPAYTLPPLLASVRPAGENADGIALSPVPAVGLSHATETGRSGSGDTLVWALESNFFDLRRDGSWSISWSMIADALADHRNGFVVAWHDWQIGLYPGGRVRVWRWADPEDVGGTPTLIDEWVVDDAVADRSGYLTIVPVPQWGLLVYLCAPTCLERQRGRMVAAPMLSDVSGSHYWPEDTTIRVAINPAVKWVLGYSAVRFPAADQVVYDAPFDLEQPPLTAPSSIPLTNLGDATATSVGVEIVKPDTTAISSWAAETARTTYRAKLTFSNGADQYLTPFFASYQPLWPPIFETRNTTEWAAEVVSNLSVTDTWDGRVEGACDVQVWSELGRKALERGDMSVVVERRDTALDDWEPVLLGLATVEGDVNVDYDSGRDRLAFGARLALRDMRYRLSEVRMTRADSLDGLTVVEGINRVLGACGFESLLSTPAGVDTTKMPVATKDGKRPRWMPKRGDDGERVLRDLLLLLRRKNKEYNVVQAIDDANPANRHRLKMVERARETDVADRWTLSLLEGDHDLGSGVVEVGSLTLSPSPPEANAVRVESYDEKQNLKYATKVTVNQDSLDDPTSRDFLGRIKLLVAHVQGIADETNLKIAARRLYDAVAHNRLTATVSTPWYVDTLRANAYVRIKGLGADGDESALLDGWVVRRTISITAEESDEDSGHERVTYEIDTVWSGRASG